MSRAPASDDSGPLPTRAPLRVLVVLAVLELVVNRVGLRAFAPPDGQTPSRWYDALNYAGLFLSYFTGTLAVALLGARAVAAIAAWRGARDVVAQVVLVATAAVFGLEVVLDVPTWVTVPAEAMFALAVIVTVVDATGRGRDLGAQIGIAVFATPLLLHSALAFGVHYRWEYLDADPARSLARIGTLALALAAMASPYCFAPRPFARAVTRPLPIIIAMTLAAGGAVIARICYAQLAPVLADAFGVTLALDHADPSLAIYLLAFATMAWTLCSCAISPSHARREIGLGIGLIALGGDAFRWPVEFLLPLVGLSVIAEATRRVRDQELAATPIAQVTPPISDAAWGAYIASVVAAFEADGKLANVHTLTTRGDQLMSTLLVGETASGHPLRMRIERLEGCVLAFDIVLGREIDELRGATFTLWAQPPRGTGINPQGPPAAPLGKTGDSELDARFELRGNASVFATVVDAGTRARAAAMLAGWLAYWERDGLRYRVYPGRGAPVDEPLPISDLALGRPATPDRLIALVELLAEMATRALAPVAAAPTALAEPEL